MRALLPRHSLLKVMYPLADDACLAPGTPLWAVGSSVMLLGERLVTLDMPSLLPPGNEWLALVMRACNGGGSPPHEYGDGDQGDQGGGGAGVGAGVGGSIGGSIGGGIGGGTGGGIGDARLISSQLAAADALASVLDLHALEAQPRVVEQLRGLLEPWLVSGERVAVPTEEAAHGEEEGGEEPCPICLSVEHVKSRQRPRVACGTCHNAFHACCLYRWLGTQPAAGRCPLCQTPM